MNDIDKLMALNTLLGDLKVLKDNLDGKQKRFDNKFEEVKTLVLSLGEEDRAIASEKSTTCAKILEAENG